MQLRQPPYLYLHGLIIDYTFQWTYNTAAFCSIQTQCSITSQHPSQACLSHLIHQTDVFVILGDEDYCVRYATVQRHKNFVRQTRIIEFKGCVVRTGGGLISLADSINIFLYFCTVMFASRHVEII